MTEEIDFEKRLVKITLTVKEWNAILSAARLRTEDCNLNEEALKKMRKQFREQATGWKID